MAQLITKLTKDFNNSLKLSGSEKPNYYAKIFEQTLWYPKLKGTQLNSAPSSKAPVEAPREPFATSETGPSTVAKNITIQASAPKKVSEKLKLDTGFDKLICEIHENWKVDTIPGFNDYHGETDIIFFGLDEIEDGELPDFLPLSMIESDQDIMGRMIKAMKVPSGRFIRVPFIKNNAREFIFSCCAHFKPKLLISLGAAATNLCLDKKVRLANVHGQFYPVQVESDEKTQVIEVMPLFHPKLLEVNESMKKTAWADMQKAIAKLSS